MSDNWLDPHPRTDDVLWKIISDTSGSYQWRLSLELKSVFLEAVRASLSAAKDPNFHKVVSFSHHCIINLSTFVKYLILSNLQVYTAKQTPKQWKKAGHLRGHKDTS